jgi:prepilin peptidase CpaA
MFEEPLKYALLAALAVALLTAAFTDLKRRRIENWLNLSIVLGAPLFWWATGLSLWPGVAMQLGLAAVTLVILTVLFALKALGGGDVKLLAALALWVDPLNFLRLLIIMSLLGGVLALTIGIIDRVKKPKDRIAVPYGVAISAAGLWVITRFYFPASTFGSFAG